MLSFMERAGPVVTTLASPISTPTQDSMTLTSGAGFPAGDFAVQIQGEVIYVGFRVGTACSNLGRGENDTTRSTHGAGSVVTLVAKLSNRRRIYFGPMGY